MKSRKYGLLWFYMMLGFVTTVSNFTIMKQMQFYGSSLSEISGLIILPASPWCVKFIFGILSDSVGFMGYHRRPYVILTNFCACMTTLVLLTPDLSFIGYLLVLFFIQIFTAWFDVILDAMMFEDCRRIMSSDAKTGPIQSSQYQHHIFVARSIGTLLGISLQAILWGLIGPEGVYITISVVYFVSFLVGFLVSDVKRARMVVVGASDNEGKIVQSIELDNKGNNLKNQVSDYNTMNTASNGFLFRLGLVKETIQHPILFKLFAFAILAGLSPTASIPKLFFMMDVLQFTPYQIGMRSFFVETGRLIGSTIYYRYLITRSLRSIYIVISALSFCVGLVPLILTTPATHPNGPCASRYTEHTNGTCYYFEQHKLDPVILSTANDFASRILDGIIGIPLGLLASHVCSKSVEAIVYSSITSVQNLVDQLKGVINGWFIRLFDLDHGNFQYLSSFILFCSLFDFFKIMVSFYIPDHIPVDTRDRETGNKKRIGKKIRAAAIGFGMDLETVDEKEISPVCSTNSAKALL